jgi:hypothetical protein
MYIPRYLTVPINEIYNHRTAPTLRFENKDSLTKEPNFIPRSNTPTPMLYHHNRYPGIELSRTNHLQILQRISPKATDQRFPVDKNADQRYSNSFLSWSLTYM